MAYRVKEIFYTLQGEGAQAGRPAVFCRFSGRLRPFCFFFNRFHKTALAFAGKFAILELQCHTIAGGGAARPGPSAENII